MQKPKYKWTFFAIASMLFAQPLSACWQDSRPPIKVTNDHVSVQFTRHGKPLDDALIMLYNRKLNVVLQIKTDKDGQATFPKTPNGAYKLVMDGPSHESFQVVLDRHGTGGMYQAIYISFSADYCAWVSLRDDPSRFDF